MSAYSEMVSTPSLCTNEELTWKFITQEKGVGFHTQSCINERPRTETSDSLILLIFETYCGAFGCALNPQDLVTEQRRYMAIQQAPSEPLVLSLRQGMGWQE